MTTFKKLKAFFITSAFLFLFGALDAQDIKYKTAKPIDEIFYLQIKKLKKSNVITIGGNLTFELYKEREKETDGPEWNYNAIIKIGNFYLPLKLGSGHKLYLSNLGSKAAPQPIILSTGCFSDAGCLEKQIVIMPFREEAFTATDFGIATYVPGEQIDYLFDRSYTKSQYNKDMEMINSNEEIAMLYYVYPKNGKCYHLIKSYKKTKKGFTKGSFSKKIPTICAG